MVRKKQIKKNGNAPTNVEGIPAYIIGGQVYIKGDNGALIPINSAPKIDIGQLKASNEPEIELVDGQYGIRVITGTSRSGKKFANIQSFKYFQGQNEASPSWHPLKNPIRFYTKTQAKAFFDYIKKYEKAILDSLP